MNKLYARVRKTSEYAHRDEDFFEVIQNDGRESAEWAWLGRQDRWGLDDLDLFIKLDDKYIFLNKEDVPAPAPYV